MVIGSGSIHNGRITPIQVRVNIGTDVAGHGRLSRPIIIPHKNVPIPTAV
ncbi:MAG: hypothetical protein KJ069_27990 [Anaerolineae bacterium]|nr:hypothetical protein [Anaerolineae bacterium]